MTKQVQDAVTDDAFTLFRGRIRDLQAEIRNLSRTLMDFEKTQEIEDAEAREKELETWLDQATEVFDLNRPQVDERLQQARRLIDENAALNEVYSYELTEMENIWDLVTSRWSRMCIDRELLAHRIPELRATLLRFVRVACRVTVPNRVRMLMEKKRVGQAMDFHAVFEEEIPNREDRDRLLRLLRAFPRWVEGIVEVKTGLIYRASPNPWRRAWSWLLLIGLGVLGLVLAWGLGWWEPGLDALGIDLDALRETAEKEKRTIPPYIPWLWTSYLMVTLGAVVHLLFDAVKAIRATRGVGAKTLTDLRLWVHVREASLVGSVLVIWFGFAALVKFSDGSLPDWRVAFLLGYGLDSVADLILDRFSKGVTTEVTALQERFAGPVGI